MEVDREMLFKVLMSEKEHADAQIRAYMDLQSKSTSIVFVALTAATGWIFASRDAELSPRDRGIALLIILLIAAFSIIYGAFTYCSALGYMWYKDRGLHPRFHKLIGDSPPRAVAGFGESPANRVVRQVAGAFNVLLMIGCVALGCVVLSLADAAPELYWWLGAAAPVVVLAAVSLWGVKHAIAETLGPPGRTPPV